jgi:RNA polymerase sigma factor (sigma-70 family)
MTNTDQDLLRQFARDGAQAAFTELVRRHVNLVYSAALRQVRSPQLAEEVAQSVFADLARVAATPSSPLGGCDASSPTSLTPWLFAVSRRTAIDVIRKESRRQLREQIAVEMNAMNATESSAGVPPAWSEIAPLLDEAVFALDETDRAAVLLRYFENKSLREVGAALGVSDDTAQKRVSRAVERLREFFSKRNVTIGASGLVVLISANAVQAAPVGLAVTISAAAVSTIGVSWSAGAGAKTLLGQSAQTKWGSWLAATTIVSVLIFTAYQFLHRTDSGMTAASLQATAETPAQDQPVAVASQNDSAEANPTEPDPVKLLRTVIRARQKIHSASIEIQQWHEDIRDGHKDKNQSRYVALFDGPRLRFDSFTPQFAYTFAEDVNKQSEIIKRSDSMDRESAIRAGLLEASETHHTVVRDGAVLFDYEDKQNPRMTISATTNGSHSAIFDPRCLGLSTFIFPVEVSMEDCLGWKEAEAELVGVEDIDGIPAYHVRVTVAGDESLDYWVDKARPERLIQRTYGLDIVKSKYDDVDLSDPLPVEVSIMKFSDGILSGTTRLILTHTRYNTPVDPSSFTLASLDMAVGTWVFDDRNNRNIGYWTGSGLSEDLPSENGQGTNSAAPTKLEEQLALLENYPASPEALQSATWILLNTPDGTAVEKAAEAILNEHTHDTDLVYLCQNLERLRHRCSKELLEAFLKDNPNVEVQGNACFTLATLLKSESKYGQNQKATAEAEKQYERVISDFSMVKQRGFSLAELAKPELDELRRLSIGKPAPKTVGMDMDGQPLSLSTYRGKVTVVVFWSGQFTEVFQFRKLMEDMAGKPFAMIGVNSDDETTQSQKYAEKVNWPSFRDGRDGPISKLWNSRCCPDIWVLDRQGIIRHRGGNLSDVVNKLIAE